MGPEKLFSLICKLVMVVVVPWEVHRSAGRGPENPAACNSKVCRCFQLETKELERPPTTPANVSCKYFSFLRLDQLDGMPTPSKLTKSISIFCKSVREPRDAANGAALELVLRKRGAVKPLLVATRPLRPKDVTLPLLLHVTADPMNCSVQVQQFGLLLLQSDNKLNWSTSSATQTRTLGKSALQYFTNC